MRTVGLVVWVGACGVLCAMGALRADDGAKKAHDWPHWGGGPSRNMVSTDTAPLPTTAKVAEPGAGDKLDPAATKNVKWAVRLGAETDGNPAVAGGRVYLGPNKEIPRHPKA